MDKIILDEKDLTLKRIMKMARDGKSYSEIGQAVGLSRQRVSQICLQHGIIRRHSDVKKENWQRYWKSKSEHLDKCLFQVTGVCTCGQSETESPT